MKHIFNHLIAGFLSIGRKLVLNAMKEM